MNTTRPNPLKNRQAPRQADPDGLLLVDKPTDWTSHDVVNKVRGFFRFKKVGHGGTLDPMATGLLVLLIGKGTKLSERVMTGDKIYKGTLRLGTTTNTQDAEGEILQERDTSAITQNHIKKACEQFLGDIEQIPPMVSAIKKDGVPLYKLARKGIEIKREPRPVTIHTLDINNITLPDVTFTVHCTKGTYVRTLCADIGEHLGCGGHLAGLIRTQSGSQSLNNALSLDDILALEREDLIKHIVSPETFAQMEPPQNA